MSKIGKMLTRDEGVLVPLVEKFLLETGTDIQIISESDKQIIEKLIMIQSDRQGERAKRTSFSGGASSSCMRDQSINFLEGIKPERITDPKVALLFDDGNWRNLKWVLLFNKMGILRKTEEVAHSKKYNVSGTPDAEVDLSAYYEDFEDLVGVEVKGMHDYEWRKFADGEGDSRWAIGRFMQSHTYMLITGRKFWIAWGENKNDQRFEENVIKRNSHVIKYLRRRYKYMLEGRELGMLPAIECTFDNSDPKFRYCRNKANCQKLLQNGYPTMKKMKNRTSGDDMVKEVMLAQVQ